MRGFEAREGWDTKWGEGRPDGSFLYVEDGIEDTRLQSTRATRTVLVGKGRDKGSSATVFSVRVEEH